MKNCAIIAIYIQSAGGISLYDSSSLIIYGVILSMMAK